jgi:hypothetical protein
MLGHDKLASYFKTNFALMQHHKYSLVELESMIPWERAMYIGLLANYIKEKETEAREQRMIAESQARARMR